ncbi:MAG: hypothetical protein EHM43_05160 [Ignavibacteriae bacterium]|nr:MAG: hypothetical protein EHM43_05160 [Ignavibacteriota bacterium]
MAALDLNMFTTGIHDPEAAQYRILGAMQAAASDLHHNRLYPGLGELVELTSILETINNNRDQYQTVLPKRLSGVDFEKKALKFDAVPADAEAIAKMFELVTWALPRLRALTDEGIAMFDFVLQNLRIDVVGIMPIYRDEGYVFVPDPRQHQYHVIRYEMSIYSDESDKYRAMKTFEIATRDQHDVMSAPEIVKLDLVREHRDLPNPATYLVDTDLDFPFENTILPVAKRKLMKVLIS